MLGTFKLTINDYGVRGTDDTTPPPGPVYTQTEADARFGATSQLSIPAGKRLVIDPDTNEITVETITP